MILRYLILLGAGWVGYTIWYSTQVKRLPASGNMPTIVSIDNKYKCFKSQREVDQYETTGVWCFTYKGTIVYRDSK